MNVRFLSLLCAATMLAACSGRMGQPASVLPGVSNEGAAQREGDTASPGKGSLRVRITIPKPDSHAHFVSPATKGMTVDVTGPTNVKQTVALVVNASGCHSTLTTVQCNLTVPGLTACPSRKNCYTASVATYDRIEPAKKRIPPGAHELSANQSFAFSVGTGPTVVQMVLDGIVKTVAFLPGPATSLSGSQATGFVEPKCGTSPQKVNVVGVDADGNYILGAGAPRVGLTSDDTAQLKVQKRKNAEPNTFTLLPPDAPNYPFGNHTIHFTATATPGTKSGASPVSAIVKVTYSLDICGVFTEFAIPTTGSEPVGITPGADGNLWFSEAVGNKIGRITTAGTITEFPLPTAASGPFGITAGPDGNIWFTEDSSSKIARMNTTTGNVFETATNTANAGPVQITTGPDGNMWFTEENASNVGRITTATGVVSEFPTTTLTSEPFGIAAGPDGNLWFVEISGNNVGKVTTAGSVTEYPVSTAASAPSDIVSGPDGALWFVECHGNSVGRVTTAGTITSQYPTPDLSATLPVFDTVGPDGKIWFSEAGVNKIGSMTTGGAFAEFAIPTSGATPFGITTGPDGAIWFVEALTNKIARVE
jgi:streptogramin lyase